jgi:hypothetical protein
MLAYERTGKKMSITKKYFGLAALGLSLLLSGAKSAKANTITVEDLVFDGLVSPGVYAWHYTTRLSSSGQIHTTYDSMFVQDIPGFLSTSADDTTVTGALGTSWDISYNAGLSQVSATYESGTKHNGAISDLVDLPFLDSYGVDGSLVPWGSQDHNTTGVEESPFTGQFVDAPAPPTSAPSPSSVLGGSALIGLMLVGKIKKALLA